MNCALLVENRDLNEVGELPGECLHALVEPGEVGLNLRPQQRLHAVVGELGAEFANGSGRIVEEASDGRADALLRPCSFQQHDIEDLDLIEAVAFRLEEAAALVDSGFDNWIVVAGKRNLGPVRFEEILVDVEAGAERLESGLQPLDGIFLLAAVKALVVNALNLQNHAEVAPTSSGTSSHSKTHTG